jgi:hypothetical protein
MGTTDGISTEDWDVVHQLAVDIVNAPDDERAKHRHRLLEHLETLESKCGALPSILATRADYLDADEPAREELLVRAFAAAELRDDATNFFEIAESLTELHLESKRLVEANQWLSQMREQL